MRTKARLPKVPEEPEQSWYLEGPQETEEPLRRTKKVKTKEPSESKDLREPEETETARTKELREPKRTGEPKWL